MSRRSRSPRRDNDWISRKVSSIGRYPENRPQGLHVHDGTFRLDDLMSTWGRKHHLHEQQVLSALTERMLQDRKTLRFSIDKDADGCIKIKVFPKRNAQHEEDYKTPPKAEYTGYRRGTSHSYSSSGKEHRRNKTSDDKMSRWLGWLLKAGHQELRIPVSPGGWAKLAHVKKAAVGRGHCSADISDSDFWDLVGGSSGDGRFEQSPDGWLRKISKRERAAKPEVDEDSDRAGDGRGSLFCKSSSKAKDEAF